MHNINLAAVLFSYVVLSSSPCLADAASKSSITYEELKTLSDIQLKLHPESRPLVDNVVGKYGRCCTYTADQIDPLLAPGEATKNDGASESTAPTHVKPRPRQGWDVVTNAVTHPKLRQNYTDVLPGEDPSQQNLATGKFSDLKGANFSYTRNGRADTTSWTAEAALIMPMIWPGNLQYGPKPIFYGVVPSVSLYRVDANGDVKDEIDSLIYRAGVFAQWLLTGGPGQKLHARLNFRGSFTYATDTGGDLQLPAGEFDLEPQIFYSPNWSLGYLFNPFVGQQAAIDPDVAHLQVRTWIHGEYGRPERSSQQVDLPKEDFFRFGPVLQLQLDVPKLPLIRKQLILSFEYHYLPTISGPGGHDTFLKTGAELTLMHVEDGPRVSIKADYTNGGLDLTKQEVNTFTMGLGVLY